MKAAGVATEILAALDAGKQIEPFADRFPDFDKEAAYAVAAALRSMRAARGERSVGRKIGFTNRSIWAEYGVFEPLWGDVYGSTLHDVAKGATIKVSHLPEPRIEPEIVMGLDRDIVPSMSADEIAQSIAWVAHGFEIVQSVFPGWRFTAADCIADGGLHGALFVGPRRSVSEDERGGLTTALCELQVVLYRDEARIDEGTAANVLDGPVLALGYLAEVLADDRLNPPLRKGEIVTTGTMTRAFPIRSGERWSTAISGFDLPGLSVEIV